eukprot:scaffold421285_cov56-Attheya_sp.AAC.2
MESGSETEGLATRSAPISIDDTLPPTINRVTSPMRVPGSVINTQTSPNRIAYHRHVSAPATSLRKDSEGVQFSRHSNHSPADFIDSKDGHIWRAKYCVLDGGVLYFYRNASDGDSPEARNEREQMSNVYDSDERSDVPSYSMNDQLSKSPITRPPNLCNFTSQKKGAPNFSLDTPVLWEKRVPLNRVGAVRSAEIEYGPFTCELIALDYDGGSSHLDDGSADGSVGSQQSLHADRLIMRAANTEEMHEWLFQFHRSLASFMQHVVESVGKVPGHSLLNKPGTSMHMGDLPPIHLSESSFPLYRHAVVPNGEGAFPVPSAAMIPPLQPHSPAHIEGLSHGHGRNFLNRERIREQKKNYNEKAGNISKSPASTPGRMSPEFFLGPFDFAPGPTVESELTLSNLEFDTKANRVERIENSAVDQLKYAVVPSGLTSLLEQSGKNGAKQLSRGSTKKIVEEPSGILRCLGENEKVKAEKVSLKNSNSIVEPTKARPALSGGAWVPPHRRQKTAVTGIRPASPGTNLPNRMLMGKSPNAKVLSPDSSESSSKLLGEVYKSQETTSILGQDNNDRIHIKLGGCADPDIAVGSILDPMFRSRKASKIGKVSSEAYGFPGGAYDQDSSYFRQSDNPESSDEKKSLDSDTLNVTLDAKHIELDWEVGAVSECGIRNSNEDSYLIMHDLIESLSRMMVEKAGGDSKYQDRKSHEKSKHGLFAIFDGHCGNQAARYAAEKLPSALLARSEHSSNFLSDSTDLNSEIATDMLVGALTALDDSFCNACTNDGRDWESGATALIALLTSDGIVVANLGDSKGVLSCATSSSFLDADNLHTDHPVHESSGWNELEIDDKQEIFDEWTNGIHDGNSSLHRNEVRSHWIDMTESHSPSRPDERERIEAANGWVTIEREVTINHQRLDLMDPDVVEILKRCFSDRYKDPASSQLSKSPSHSKGCNAKPGRLLQISRVCGELAVSRALGDRDFKASFSNESNIPLQPDASQDSTTSGHWWEGPVFLPYADNHNKSFRGDLVSSTPEVQVMKLGKEGVFDEFLLLACDGLWDVMDSDDAVRVTRDLLYERKWSAKKAAARLAELAIHLGSSDNVTVIIVRFFDRSNLQKA